MMALCRQRNPTCLIGTASDAVMSLREDCQTSHSHHHALCRGYAAQLSKTECLGRLQRAQIHFSHLDRQRSTGSGRAPTRGALTDRASAKVGTTDRRTVSHVRSLGPNAVALPVEPSQARHSLPFLFLSAAPLPSGPRVCCSCH